MTDADVDRVAGEIRRLLATDVPGRRGPSP
jgi:hypothetical protein